MIGLTITLYLYQCEKCLFNYFAIGYKKLVLHTIFINYDVRFN